MPSEPTSVGRGMVEATQPACTVTKCGSSRCKTCKHMVEGDSLISNVTNSKYNIVSPSGMDCGTCNVVYLISCKKCGIQYIGKTTQTIRRRVNNHRNKLKQLCDLYLYNHFNSDGHSIDDLQIMPIEEVVVDPAENITLDSKLLIREEYWYKEICSIYPYGLKVTGYRSPTRGPVSLILRMQAGTIFGVSFFAHGRPPTVNS